MEVADRADVNKMTVSNLAGTIIELWRPCSIALACTVVLCSSSTCCCTLSKLTWVDVTAVVFAPTLFYIRGSKGQQMLKEVEMQVTTASTLKTMLLNHDKIWNVSQHAA
jgi:hypothetical protein